MIQKKKSPKLSEFLNIYSQKLNDGLNRKPSLISFELQFKYKSPHIAIVSGYIIFRIGWILEFDEILEQTGIAIARLKYRYHVMDKNKDLIFRYDNVAHFPKIKAYPHHKHLKKEVVESNAPGLLDVVDEVEVLMVKDLLV